MIKTHANERSIFKVFDCYYMISFSFLFYLNNFIVLYNIILPGETSDAVVGCKLIIKGPQLLSKEQATLNVTLNETLPVVSKKHTIKITYSMFNMALLK
jgi:hypothetical protein